MAANLCFRKNTEKSSFIQKYLIVFAQEHLKFRYGELDSICSLLNISIDKKFLKLEAESPFLIIDLPSDSEALKISSRSILIKCILKLYGYADSWEDLVAILGHYNSDDLLQHTPSSIQTYKITVESFNKKLDHAKKLAYIDCLSFLPLNGVVNLKNPVTTFMLFLDHSLIPTRFFFGRLISYGQRHLIKYYSIKTRHFIGNTTMDVQLALIMANMGQCHDGMLVYDPFVGSGSILVACSHFGSYSCGSDIDRTLLLGRGHPSRADKGKWRGIKGESIKSNFEMYKLENHYVDVWMGDQMNTPLRKSFMFDAIVTDPPYGIREGSRKLAKALIQNAGTSQSILGVKLPSTECCLLSDAIYNLLQFAAAHLVLNGRLVYWLPSHRGTFKMEHIPTHPCLKLLFVSEQILSGNVSRHLITMEKIKEPKKSDNLNIDKNLREIHNRFRNHYFKVAKNG
ncbi:tRNA (guanine(10)-N2)-methyltransferase homolog [Xenia sp. Carnegie-2017]|uniref:tRNA (guanine(10)-N2)-methyltransferase homolog n=1 Tax=Xenia sp. Carnegie-2017 TaxID=2897299 RepID=UPI001F03C1DB|nr:tRNA (guanine(10)-N2)-methyltransferase homolog [Xenia sp. Carnegie-2017]